MRPPSRAVGKLWIPALAGMTKQWGAMQRSEIRGAADTRHIQSGPYSAFMSHAGVHEALSDAAARYARRRALTFIVEADPATPPRRIADLMRAFAIAWRYEPGAAGRTPG